MPIETIKNAVLWSFLFSPFVLVCLVPEKFDSPNTSRLAILLFGLILAAVGVTIRATYLEATLSEILCTPAKLLFEDPLGPFFQFFGYMLVSIALSMWWCSYVLKKYG